MVNKFKKRQFIGMVATVWLWVGPFTELSLAEDAKSPDVQEWMRDIAKKHATKPLDVMGTVALVRGIDDKGQLLIEFDQGERGETFFRAATDENAQAFRALNQGWAPKARKDSCCTQEDWQMTAILTGADTIFHLHPGGKIEIWRPKKDKWVKVALLSSYEGKNATELMEAARKRLGYDGYVLDMRDDLLLVASLQSARLKAGIQALTLTGTEEQLVLKATKRSGSGLVEMVGEPWQGAAVFKVLLKGERAIVPGTKLIFETKQSVAGEAKTAEDSEAKSEGSEVVEPAKKRVKVKGASEAKTETPADTTDQ